MVWWCGVDGGYGGHPLRRPWGADASSRRSCPLPHDSITGRRKVKGKRDGALTGGSRASKSQV
jgi:hypothetical protein